jgi:hypothetical protein
MAEKLFCPKYASERHFMVAMGCLAVLVQCHFEGGSTQAPEANYNII